MTTHEPVPSNEKQQQQQQTEKNIGCISSFFSISHILSPKRFHPKRLPPSSGIDSSSDAAVSSMGSPVFSTELIKPTPSPNGTSKPPPSTPPPPEINKKALPAVTPEKSPVAVCSFEFKEGVKSPWKFAREAPRLSLDSRFVVDAKGGLHPREIRTKTTTAAAASSSSRSGGDDDNDKQRRSPSVIARLMGLEPSQPTSGGSGGEESGRKLELRRSASESRSRDLIHFPSFIIDSNTFKSSNSNAREFSDIYQLNGNTAKSNRSINAETLDRRPPPPSPLQQQQQQQRKICYDSGDFFPEPKRTASIYGDRERRFKTRGPLVEDTSSKDLETLNQILEAIQLKGLLHSNPPSDHHTGHRNNFVFDRRFLQSPSPIVVMKPRTSPPAKRTQIESPPRSGSKPAASHRNVNLAVEKPKVRRNEGPEATRRKPAMSTEARRRERERERGVADEQRRGSPRRFDQTTTSHSPTKRRPTAEICRREKPRVPAEDESSTVSECSYTDTERWKMEEYKGGKSLLERCDKLLNSIAEMTATSATTTMTELQPSPVSVLGSSSFNRDEDDSPSPVMKRTIDFQEVEQVVELEDEIWSPLSSVVHFNITDTSNYAYVAEVLRASVYLPQGTSHFLLLEKEQLLKGNDASKSSRIQRRLLFDTITEILDRNQQLPPWKLTSLGTNFVPGKPSLNQIWSELQRIWEPAPSDDLLDTTWQVLKRDLANDPMTGWDNWSIEISDMVLDIERLVFKDLICKTISDFATFQGKSAVPRRKLVF